MTIETSFLLIESDWACDRVHRLVQGIRPRWVVVRRTADGEDLYYAFKRPEMLARVSANDTLPVGAALDLHKTDAAPTSAADTGNADRPTVVVSRGRVVGIVSRSMVIEPGPLYKVFRAEAPVDRAIVASAPPQVALGATVSLVVSLVTRTSKAYALWLKAHLGEEIDVVVQASGGLAVKGTATGTLKVVEADVTTMPPFTIVGNAIGPGEVSVLVFQRGQSVGSVDVAIQTVAEVSNANPTTGTARIEPVPAQQPDLQLLVLESGRGADVSYTMYFKTADPTLLNFTPFTFSLRQDPRTFFDALYAEIETILASGATAPQKLQRLGIKGTYLFQQLMPEAARATLWDLRERIKSVHVLSQEPWVPWELIKPSGNDGGGTIIEAGFLCESYELTRWVPGLAYPRKLTMKDIGLVIPAGSGLSASPSECATMLALATPERHVTQIEAEEVALRKALAGGTLDVVHFTGHGAAGGTNADRAEIQLGFGSRLRPEDLTGETANLGKRSPIVFLNACEIGRAGIGLTQPGGWPRAFLAAGAGAFIGPLWKIADGSAGSFAKFFYKELLRGASVGAAARTARLSIQVASDPTWLAYSVYAHCDAKLS